MSAADARSRGGAADARSRGGVREGKHRKPIHLGAHFPGVNNTTVWSDPESGSQIEFDSFVHLARTAERGLFDFLFLAEGLRLREHRGRIHDPGRGGPTGHLHRARGARRRHRSPRARRHHQHHLQRTVRSGTAIHLPRPPLRRPCGLEHGDVIGCVHRGELPSRWLSRRRRPLPARRGIHHRRAGVLVWDSWAPDAVLADRDDGIYVDPTRIHTVEHRGPQFTVRGAATLPAGPQGIRCCCRPVTPPTAARSVPSMPMLCSLCTPHSARASVVTPTSSNGQRPTVEIPAGSGFSDNDVCAGRHADRGRRQGSSHSVPARQRADGDRDARTGLGA